MPTQMLRLSPRSVELSGRQRTTTLTHSPVSFMRAAAISAAPAFLSFFDMLKADERWCTR